MATGIRSGIVVAMLRLAALLLLALSPAHAQRCPTAGKLVARTAQAELRWHDNTLFGCYRPDGIRRVLWRWPPHYTAEPMPAPRPAKLAGRYAATVVDDEAPVYGNAMVLLANLHTGAKHVGAIRRLVSQPGNGEGVRRLVLRATGTAAWTAWSEMYGFEVRMMRHNGVVTILDGSPCIDPASLRLRGRRAVWDHCGQRRARVLP